MTITNEKIDAFCQWLRRHGRSDGTIALYKSNLRRCSEHKHGLTGRLLDKSLAPKTRRTNLAALQAWAKYTKDHELRDELGEIRLPPATRVKAKVPLDPEAWKTFVQAVQKHKRLSDVVRCCILIMAFRGLRVSDVLRIKRKDAQKALSNGRLIYTGKGDKQIEIAVLPIREPIEQLIDEGEWDAVADLFPCKFANAAQRVRRAVKRVGNKLKIEDVHPHRLRRSYATAFLKRHHGDPQALIKLTTHMQWASINVAAGYVDSVDRDDLDREGVEMIRALLSDDDG